MNDFIQNSRRDTVGQVMMELLLKCPFLKEEKKKLLTLFERKKKRSIRQKICERKLILAQHLIETNEIPFLDKCIFEKNAPSSIIQFLKKRTINSLQKMISILY